MQRTHILKGFSDIAAALWVHKYNPGLMIKDMVRTALDQGFNVSDTANFEATQLLGEWGLSDKKTKVLTPKGEKFYLIWETKRNTAIDVLHGLQYGLWTKAVPSQSISSWSYKMVCNYLWERQELPGTKQLATYISDLRSNQSEVIIFDTSDAFSGKSIRDAYDWLLPLDPPVLHGVSIDSKTKSYRNASFKRRQFCSTALFIMGLAYILRESGTNFGELIKLDDSRRHDVCAYCLIEETSFDFMLDDALRKVPYISIQKGWDLFLVMKREPEFTDFLD